VKPLTLPAKLSVASLAGLGLLGGSLIVAYSGYETSPRRGGASVFVPVPEAYLIAAMLYGASCLALLVLVRDRSRSLRASAAAVVGYGLVAWLAVRALGPWVS